MKRRYGLLGAILLAGGLAVLFAVQGRLRQAAHRWEGERSPKGPYILETFRQDTAEAAMASFRILSAAEESLLYTCPDAWRAIDLKGIQWTEEGWDVQILSGDVGTVTYVRGGESWHGETDSPLAFRAAEGESLSPRLLLAPVSLEETLQGELVGYARIRSGGWVFEWLESDYYEKTSEMEYQEEKVLLFREGSQDCQVFELWDYSDFDVEAEEKLLYEDVDFDGKPDLLVSSGHHGNQGFITYDCYLQREDGFEECPSYGDIRFPSIDPENKRILSFQRNWAASHTWGIYEFQDGEFVPTHWLTEEPAPDWQPTKVNDENVIWQWTMDGQVVGTSDTLSEEEIHQLFAYFGRG